MFNLGSKADVTSIAQAIAKQSKRDIGEKETELIESLLGSDSIEPDYFKEKLVTFSSVINGMRSVTAVDYIKAVQYCSYMSLGDSQYNAYCKTHPDRVAAKSNDGTVRASANLYHKTDLVQKILAMAEIPFHLMFMSKRYAAIEKLSDLMMNSGSDRIQMESADKLLTHLKPPESSKIEIDIGIGRNSAISSLEATLTALAIQQVDMIGSGKMSAKNVVDAELITEDDNE